MKKANDIEIDKIDIDSVEFQNALKLIQYTNQSVFLTGKAGTGKSTFLKYLTATTKKKHVVLAPTGIAAVNAGGQTIHSFFKLPFKPILPEDPEFDTPRRLKQRLKYTKEHVKLIKELDLIIIDEVSMVRADTIDFINRILQVYCGNYRQPFGGKQLLLVGDVFQLEPVITGDMRDVLSYYYKEGTFFFNARAFELLSVVPIELTKVYRQNDDAFIGMLDRIRIGRPATNDIMMLNQRIASDDSLSNDDFTITIATRRDIVDQINQSRLARLKRPEVKYRGDINGEFPDNALPTDLELVLKEGAQIVFVRNDMERRWVNGTIGKVAELNKDTIIVELEGGTKHEVERDVWENVRYEYDEEKKMVKEIVIGTYTQFPIKLAWALTIHKSQGLTFDKVVIDVGTGAFSGGQTYVALSRCRSLEGIKMRSTINPRDIFVNSRVVRFSQSFNNDMIINAALENARADDYYHRAAACFDRGQYSEAVRLFSEAVCMRNELYRENVVRLIAEKLIGLGSLSAKVVDLERELAENRRKFKKLAIEYVDLGEDVREEGWELQAAIANYDKAISLCPDYYMAWLCKGLALAEMNDFDAALDALQKAADLDKKDYRALYEGGRMLVNNGDISQGMDMLLHALQRNDKVADIHFALADGYERIGDDDNTELHRRKAQKLKSKRKK